MSRDLAVYGNIGVLKAWQNRDSSPESDLKIWGKYQKISPTKDQIGINHTLRLQLFLSKNSQSSTVPNLKISTTPKIPDAFQALLPQNQSISPTTAPLSRQEVQNISYSSGFLTRKMRSRFRIITCLRSCDPINPAIRKLCFEEQLE